MFKAIIQRQLNTAHFLKEYFMEYAGIKKILFQEPSFMIGLKMLKNQEYPNLK